MRRFVWLVLVLSVSWVWATAALAQMKEGLWEITTADGDGGDEGHARPDAGNDHPAMHHEKGPCPEAAEKGKGPGLQNQRPEDQRRHRGPMPWNVQERTAVVQISGKMTYKDNMFEGTSTTNFQGKGRGEMQMTNKMTGKYIGPCPK